MSCAKSSEAGSTRKATSTRHQLHCGTPTSESRHSSTVTVNASRPGLGTCSGPHHPTSSQWTNRLHAKRGRRNPLWLFTEKGLYSVVIDSQHENRMLIRPSCKADIFNLCDDHDETLTSMTDESRDYRWRPGLDKTD